MTKRIYPRPKDGKHRYEPSDREWRESLLLLFQQVGVEPPADERTWIGILEDILDTDIGAIVLGGLP